MMVIDGEAAAVSLAFSSFNGPSNHPSAGLLFDINTSVVCVIVVVIVVLLPLMTAAAVDCWWKGCTLDELPRCCLSAADRAALRRNSTFLYNEKCCSYTDRWLGWSVALLHWVIIITTTAIITTIIIPSQCVLVAVVMNLDCRKDADHSSFFTFDSGALRSGHSEQRTPTSSSTLLVVVASVCLSVSLRVHSSVTRVALPFPFSLFLSLCRCLCRCRCLFLPFSQQLN